MEHEYCKGSIYNIYLLALTEKTDSLVLAVPELLNVIEVTAMRCRHLVLKHHM